MDQEQYFISFLWGPRRESSKECAERLFGFLKALKKIDPILSVWHEAEDGKRVQQTRPNLEASLAVGVNRTDVGNKVIPDLGFRIFWWNREDPASVVLYIRCSVYTELLNNIVSLDLPCVMPTLERVVQLPVIEKIIEAIVEHWEPDRGRVNSFQLRKAIEPNKVPTVNDIEAGWVTYLSNNYGTPTGLPKSARVKPVGESGHIIIATDERVTYKNKKHLEAVKRIGKWIKASFS